MIKNIKKIRFNIAPQSYGEMGHLEFFNKDVPLKVNIGKDGKHYFLRLQKTSTLEETV